MMLAPAVICHKEPASGKHLRSKAPSRGLWMPELVLYGIRRQAKQFLGTVLDIEVDQSVMIIIINNIPEFPSKLLLLFVKPRNSECLALR